jgi:hypothetical protein
MDTALVQVFINAGVAGGVLLTIMFGWLVPKSYVSKLEKEIEFLRTDNAAVKENNRELVQTVAMNNQIIGELRSLAHKRQEA